MNENIICIDIKDLKNIEGFTYINHGHYGECYKYKDNTIKLFFDKKSFPTNTISLFIKLNDEIVRFPIKILVDKNNIPYGYIYKYAQGTTLNNIDKETTLTSILKKYQTLKFAVE